MPSLAEHLEVIRVELVCASRSPDARSREPDFGAAHRAVCAALADLAASKRAWRDSPDGPVWFRLVPIQPPLDGA